MKIEIDTTSKTITILDKTSITELLSFLGEKNLNDFSIVCKNTIQIVEKKIDFPYPNKSPWPNIMYTNPLIPDPIEGWKVTCKVN